MNRLKSIFISVSVTIWGYFSYLFVQEIIGGSSLLHLVGLFLISITPLGFFSILLSIRPWARTSRSLLLLTIVIASGSVITLLGVNQQALPAYFQYVALTSIIMWLFYVYWYSVMPTRLNELKIGATLPELTFINEEKNKISTSYFAGKKMLYMFYRGNWCPLCMAQIKEISKQYKELENRGVEVLLISPQPVSHSISLAKKMKVKFHFLTDKKNAMAQKLKIDQLFGVPLGMEIFGYKSETVLPTVIITDESGEIIFLDQTDNYRVRPEPITFLDALDKLAK
jgi:peroxiredoxin